MYVFYGAMGTAAQLMRFGFCADDNPHDTVPFQVPKPNPPNPDLNPNPPYNPKP